MNLVMGKQSCLFIMGMARVLTWFVVAFSEPARLHSRREALRQCCGGAHGWMQCERTEATTILHGGEGSAEHMRKAAATATCSLCIVSFHNNFARRNAPAFPSRGKHASCASIPGAGSAASCHFFLTHGRVRGPNGAHSDE